jgi:hypothetical protein
MLCREINWVIAVAVGSVWRTVCHKLTDSRQMTEHGRVVQRSVVIFTGLANNSAMSDQDADGLSVTPLGAYMKRSFA